MGSVAEDWLRFKEMGLLTALLVALLLGGLRALGAYINRRREELEMAEADLEREQKLMPTELNDLYKKYAQFDRFEQSYVFRKLYLKNEFEKLAIIKNCALIFCILLVIAALVLLVYTWPHAKPADPDLPRSAIIWIESVSYFAV